MRRVLMFLSLVACGPDAVVMSDAREPDAEVSASLARCMSVGMGFCSGMAECRPLTSADGECMIRWRYWKCGEPEPLSEQAAFDCGEIFKNTPCPEWWANGWWESTAPTCAEVLSH